MRYLAALLLILLSQHTVAGEAASTPDILYQERIERIDKAHEARLRLLNHNFNQELSELERKKESQQQWLKQKEALDQLRRYEVEKLNLQKEQYLKEAQRLLREKSISRLQQREENKQQFRKEIRTRKAKQEEIIEKRKEAMRELRRLKQENIDEHRQKRKEMYNQRQQEKAEEDAARIQSLRERLKQKQQAQQQPSAKMQLMQAVAASRSKTGKGGYVYMDQKTKEAPEETEDYSPLRQPTTQLDLSGKAGE